MIGLVPLSIDRTWLRSRERPVPVPRLELAQIPGDQGGNRDPVQSWWSGRKVEGQRGMEPNHLLVRVSRWTLTCSSANSIRPSVLTSDCSA
jgi:hypothetical protein